MSETNDFKPTEPFEPHPAEQPAQHTNIHSASMREKNLFGSFMFIRILSLGVPQ